MDRPLLSLMLAALACLALAPAAAAADRLVVADPAAEQLTALDGTLVWVSGAFGAQRLMMRGPDGATRPLPRAPLARSYRAIDLGLDRAGGLRLTYRRCDADGRCKLLWDDLDGRRATFRGLTPPRCELTAASVWRSRVAYGLLCGGSPSQRRLSGLYVRHGARRPARLPRPRDAVRFGIRQIESVDLRGTRVAAVVADVYEYSFSQTTAGRGMRAFLAAASEGESDASARGLAIEDAGTHWTLTTASHSGDPDATVVFRRSRDCLASERILSPADSFGVFEAIDLAVDGRALYLVAPGRGIVAHDFAPTSPRSCG